MTIDERNNLAYNICNSHDSSMYYPLVYETARRILYKGKPTKKQLKACQLLQSDDLQKQGYVPEHLLKSFKTLLLYV